MSKMVRLVLVCCVLAFGVYGCDDSDSTYTPGYVISGNTPTTPVPAVSNTGTATATAANGAIPSTSVTAKTSKTTAAATVSGSQNLTGTVTLSATTTDYDTPESVVPYIATLGGVKVAVQPAGIVKVTATAGTTNITDATADVTLTVPADAVAGATSLKVYTVDASGNLTDTGITATVSGTTVTFKGAKTGATYVVGTTVSGITAVPEVVQGKCTSTYDILDSDGAVVESVGANALPTKLAKSGTYKVKIKATGPDGKISIFYKSVTFTVVTGT